MGFYDKMEKKFSGTHSSDSVPAYTGEDDVGHGVVSENADLLQRRLGNRQIQLIAIGKIPQFFARPGAVY